MDTSGMFKTTEPTVSEVDEALATVRADLAAHNARREDLKRRIAESYPKVPVELQTDLAATLAMIESLPALIEQLETVDRPAAQVREHLSLYRVYYAQWLAVQRDHNAALAVVESARQALKEAEAAAKDMYWKFTEPDGELKRIKGELSVLMGGESSRSRAINRIEHEVLREFEAKAAEKASQDDGQRDENEAA